MVGFKNDNNNNNVTKDKDNQKAFSKTQIRKL